MFFEGSEKKIEVVLSPSCGNLRLKDWAPLVSKIGAQILSQMSSPSCTAYLLSESSLFVWDHRLTMITCGQTTLIHAAIDLFKEYGTDNVELFTFERKNEFFPQHQKSDVFTDMELLSQHLPGKAYRFGDANEHHLFLFHLDRNFHSTTSDQTLEILMYELQGEAHHIFMENPHQLKRIRELLQFSEEFNGFKMDEYIFEPAGYSCNALENDKYFTIHVTPQKISPYVSFETNVISEVHKIINSVTQIFQPKSFDMVHFNLHASTVPCNIVNYQIINNISQKLSCGYYVGFASYYQPPSSSKEALDLNSIKERL